MHIVIFVTSANKKQAYAITQALLEKKLVACVNIVPRVSSFFWWKKKIDKAEESLLIIKSKKSKLARIIKTVKAMHSYTVPEIIAMPIIGGNKEYLEWLDGSVDR